MNEPAQDPWSVTEEQFSGDSTIAEKIRCALRYAILAPSSHNTQPWRFVVDQDRILVCSDRSRALRVSDPFDRELAISCGAALFNLRVALSRFRLPYRIRFLPAQADPDVLAEVHITTSGFVDHLIGDLLPAITRRVTTRERFAQTPVPATLQQTVVDAAAAEGVTLMCVAAEAPRTRIAELIAEADRQQFSNPAFRRELAHWLKPPHHNEGMPGYAGFAEKLLEAATPIAASIVRTFDIGTGAAAVHRELVAGSPLLLLFSTQADDPGAWLAAGQALERVLLTLAQDGVTVSYLNQPIEIEPLRNELARLCGIGGHPQLLLRAGYGPRARHSARRPLDAVTS